jgi:hypothetical protein
LVVRWFVRVGGKRVFAVKMAEYKCENKSARNGCEDKHYNLRVLELVLGSERRPRNLRLDLLALCSDRSFWCPHGVVMSRPGHRSHRQLLAAARRPGRIFGTVGTLRREAQSERCCALLRSQGPRPHRLLPRREMGRVSVNGVFRCRRRVTDVTTWRGFGVGPRRGPRFSSARAKIVTRGRKVGTPSEYSVVSGLIQVVYCRQ